MSSAVKLTNYSLFENFSLFFSSVLTAYFVLHSRTLSGCTGMWEMLIQIIEATAIGRACLEPKLQLKIRKAA